MIPGYYSPVDGGHLYTVGGEVVDLFTGEVKVRLYSVEEAREYLVSPDDFEARMVWQGAWFTAAELNARRQAWRDQCNRTPETSEIPF